MRYLKRKRMENAGKPRGFWGRKTMRDMNKSHSDLTDWGLSFLNFGEDDVILDIGCGGGRTVQKLATRTKGKVYGIDHAPTAVTKSLWVNKKAVDKGQVGIVEATVSALPFGVDTFTKVTAIETVYFWPDLVNDLKEVRRVLKKDGQLLITTEDRADSGKTKDYGAMPGQNGFFVPSATSLAKALKAAGFHRIEANIRGEWLSLTAKK
ncbi:MAG TPA: class I SAM-dependent methyltransferase [Clostridiales bacterium]|nr:class I SAM-dependent methyltransferase [Clostridiales bacterium]